MSTPPRRTTLASWSTSTPDDDAELSSPPIGVAAKVRLVGLCVLVLAGACSGGSDSARETTSTPAPRSRPPEADLSFTGDPELSGPGADPSVRCNWPDLEGLSIAVLATPPDSGLLARIALRPGHVTVVLSSVTGPEHRERAFTGVGVTSFDPAEGTRIESALTETAAAPGTTTEGIGTLTAVRGTVDCGDQTAGSATVRLTGETAVGPLSGAVLDPVRVECDATEDGDEVAATGITTVGATRALVAIGLLSDGAVSVDKTLPSGGHQYLAYGTSTVSPTGGRVRADVVEQGTSARTLHVEGELTCGRNAAG